MLIFAADEIGPVFIIRDMLALMEEGCDLVSCTRYAHGGGRLGGSLLGRTLSTTANFLFRRLTRSSLSDLTTGIKMFRCERFDDCVRAAIRRRCCCRRLLRSVPYCFRRAGADAVITYHAKTPLWLSERTD